MLVCPDRAAVKRGTPANLRSWKKRQSGNPSGLPKACNLPPLPTRIVRFPVSGSRTFRLRFQMSLPTSQDPLRHLGSGGVACTDKQYPRYSPKPCLPRALAKQLDRLALVAVIGASKKNEPWICMGPAPTGARGVPRSSVANCPAPNSCRVYTRRGLPTSATGSSYASPESRRLFNPQSSAARIAD